MDEIIQEKISADHLLYVSLKYTKTCDVIVNLILRWKELMDKSIDKMLLQAKRKKKIKIIPNNPIGKIEEMRKIFKKDKSIKDALGLYDMFKKIRELRTERIGEFRKNVTLRVFYRGEEIPINLDQLKIYAEIMENFVASTKKFLST